MLKSNLYINLSLTIYSLKSVDYYALTPKQDSDDIDDSPDLGGIEVKMRRRHKDLLGESQNSVVQKQREASEHPGPQNPLHPSFEMYQVPRPDSVFPVNTTYGQGVMSPTVYNPSNFGGSPQRHPQSSFPLAAGLAMAGGMAMGMGGGAGKEALIRSPTPPLPVTQEADLERGYDDELPPGSPHTVRYI